MPEACSGGPCQWPRAASLEHSSSKSLVCSVSIKKPIGSKEAHALSAASFFLMCPSSRRGPPAAGIGQIHIPLTLTPGLWECHTASPNPLQACGRCIELDDTVLISSQHMRVCRLCKDDIPSNAELLNESKRVHHSSSSGTRTPLNACTIPVMSCKRSKARQEQGEHGEAEGWCWHLWGSSWTSCSTVPAAAHRRGSLGPRPSGLAPQSSSQTLCLRDKHSHSNRVLACLQCLYNNNLVLNKYR